MCDLNILLIDTSLWKLVLLQQQW